MLARGVAPGSYRQAQSNGVMPPWPSGTQRPSLKSFEPQKRLAEPNRLTGRGARFKLPGGPGGKPKMELRGERSH
jgi:hypothetical protein